LRNSIGGHGVQSQILNYLFAAVGLGLTNCETFKDVRDAGKSQK